jgi:hypothetical protein
MAKLLLLSHLDLVKDLKSYVYRILVRLVIDNFNNMLDIKLGQISFDGAEIRRVLTQITIIKAEYRGYICLLCQRSTQSKRKIAYDIYCNNMPFSFRTNYICRSCMEINRLLQI